jgi:hypothetical protein
MYPVLGMYLVLGGEGDIEGLQPAAVIDRRAGSLPFGEQLTRRR